MWKVCVCLGGGGGGRVQNKDSILVGLSVEKWSGNIWSGGPFFSLKIIVPGPNLFKKFSPPLKNLVRGYSLPKCALYSPIQELFVAIRVARLSQERLSCNKL